MRAREFDRREITPETEELVWFIIHEESAKRAIKKKFGKVIKECGGALNVPGKYWSMIENMAYTSGGHAEIVAMPKKCAEKTTLTVDKTPTTIDTTNKKIKFESREQQREFIMFVNGKIPMASWIDLLYEHETSNRLLTESVSPEVEAAIEDLEGFGTTRLKVGQSYIPVPLMAIGDRIQLWDIEGNYPPKTKAEWCELLATNSNEMKFDVKGRPVTYPYSFVSDRMTVSVIVCASVDEYEQLRTVAVLRGLDRLPDISDSIDEAEEDVLTGQFDKTVDQMNDAGAGVEAHTQIDNYIQQAMAPKKPIQNVPMP